MARGWVGWLAGALLSARAGAEERPNLLLILADDCTCRDMAVYGGQARTPNLQALAGEGLRFDRHGLRDRTLVLVLGEQGNSFPFAKWTCYEAGLQSACIARWPGRVKPGSVSTALVEYVDVVPTFLDAAGLAVPADLDGRSFLPVLEGRAASHKTHVFGLQTTRGINHGSDHYGIRSVRDARHRYILNLTPDAVFRNAATRDPVFLSWQRIADAGDAAAARLVNAYQRRPAEELYDCDADPWNLTNLVGRADLAAVRDGLRARLDQWMKQQGDEGQATEMKALERMPRTARADETAGDRRAGAGGKRRKKAETP